MANENKEFSALIYKDDNGDWYVLSTLGSLPEKFASYQEAEDYLTKR